MKTADELKELLKTKKASEINFSEFSFLGAKLREADLRGADLEGAFIDRAHFYKSKLCKKNIDFFIKNYFGE